VSRAHKLPDVLAPGLEIVFVGTAAGARSAAEGVYYAHPGNKFWRTLKKLKLLPEDFAPGDFAHAPKHGIGFTDMCKVRAGSDAEIGNDAFDRPRFARAVRRARPRAIAFTSKKAASVWLGRPTARIAYGRQEGEDPAVFVLPSPSGMAGGYWDEGPWAELATWLRRPRRPSRTGRSPG
jgi:TDG/mug DNA glycosylase family protein